MQILTFILALLLSAISIAAPSISAGLDRVVGRYKALNDPKTEYIQLGTCLKSKLALHEYEIVSFDVPPLNTTRHINSCAFFSDKQCKNLIINDTGVAMGPEFKYKELPGGPEAVAAAYSCWEEN